MTTTNMFLNLGGNGIVSACCFFKQVGHLFIINIIMTVKSVNCGSVKKYSSKAVIKCSATLLSISTSIM